MNNPVYDLIVGNIQEVRDPSNPNLNWNLNPINVQNPDVTGAVETRHQKLVKRRS